MMETIKVLPDEIINQIAAGEVVERPSHLVKELCENALDAGASQVEIEVKNGGRNILVRDNGTGIRAEEISLALQRHTTSKLSKVEDIWDLNSYGFRGEALASIASISDLSLTSRTRDSELGTRIRSRFGKLEAKVQLGAEYGTQVRVENLFENIPARLKFLKSANSEISQIRNVVRALALTTPEVQWRFLVDGQLDQFFAQASPENRVSQTFQDLKIYYGEAEVSSYQAKVWFVDPHETVKTNRNIWIFAQGRWVQDRALVAAVMEGYRNILMHHEYPQIVVSLRVPKHAVDVNIHPTKSQVKFENPSNAFRAIVHAIRQGLDQASWLEGESHKTKMGSCLSEVIYASPLYQGTEPQQLKVLSPEFEQTRFRQRPFEPSSLVDASPLETPKISDWNEIREIRDQQLSCVSKNLSDLSLMSKSYSVGYWQGLQIIGQAGLTYILCQNSEGLVIIDQHAADERVRFEKISAQIAEGRFSWQNLLFPIVVDLTPEKKDAVLSVSEKLEKLGLKIEEVGPSSVSIASHADWVADRKIPDLLFKVADQIMEYGDTVVVEQSQSDWISSQACHGAIRSGKALSEIEIKLLLQEMDRFPLSSFCPHGRPVSVKKSFIEMDKEFGRIVT